MSRPLRLLAAEDPLVVLSALRDALSGVGPAIWPLGPGASPPEEVPDRVRPNVALVVETSGSSGDPKRVVLTTDALLASAAFAEAALGAPGQWLLALPAHYIAGINVLVRSLAGGTQPVIADARFDPDDVLAAAGRMTGEHRYISLVPAQLARLMETDAAGDTLRRFDRILIGGQALPGPLRDRAEELELRITRTYGSSETGGGCVYDGRPIGDTRVRIVDGQVELAGSVLASGYLDAAQTERAFHTVDGLRWYRSQDTGTLGNDTNGPLLAVTGRADDVIISGGVKVSLAAVERVLQAVPGLEHCAVTNAPSERWGEVPVLVLEQGGTADLGADADAGGETLDAQAQDAQAQDAQAQDAQAQDAQKPDAADAQAPNAQAQDAGPGEHVAQGRAAEYRAAQYRAAEYRTAQDRAAILAAARIAVGDVLGPAARPHRLVVIPVIPRLASGKPDRAALRALAAAETAPLT